MLFIKNTTIVHAIYLSKASRKIKYTHFCTLVSIAPEVFFTVAAHLLMYSSCPAQILFSYTEPGRESQPNQLKTYPHTSLTQTHMPSLSCQLLHTHRLYTKHASHCNTENAANILFGAGVLVTAGQEAS